MEQAQAQPSTNGSLITRAAVRLPFCCRDNSMVSDSAGRYFKEEASDVCVMEESLRVMEVSL